MKSERILFMAAESRARTFSLLIIASAIWGFQPVCIKWLLDEWSPVTITAVRYFLFSAILFAIVWHREGRQLIPQGRTWVSLVLMGLGFMLNNVLQITGIGLTTVTNSTLISATSPANTAFLAAVFVRERLSVLSWAGIFISFLGTLTVISDGNLVLVSQIGFNWGDILCFLGQLAWTVYALISIPVLKHLSAGAATAWSALFSAFFTTAWGLVTDDLAVPLLSLPALGSFAYVLFGGGLIATLFWNLGVQKAGASLSAIFLNIMPVVGMLGGWLVFSESISPAKAIGAAAIFLGVYLTTHSGTKLTS